MDKRIALRDFSLLIALVLIALYFYTRDPRFLSSRNLTQLGYRALATAGAVARHAAHHLAGPHRPQRRQRRGLIGGVAAVLISKQDWAAPPALLVTTAASRS
jgi:hypothetical protein